MSNKYSSLTVVLEENIGEEEAKRLADAILLMRRVLCVDLGTADILTEHIAESRVRGELAGKLWDILYPGFRPSK